MARLNSSHSLTVPVLRKWIARTPGGSKAVARGTGISWRQVRALRDGQVRVKDYELAAFVRFIGAGFLNEWLHEIGFGGARKLTVDVCPHKILARTNRASAVLADALADNGRVDHHEEPAVNAALAAAEIPVSFGHRKAA